MINQQDKITVVIPNYNGREYITGCIDSLLAGTWVPEIIVVDNGSTDGSADEIAARYPDVILLRLSANTGFCHAVNAGIHITRRPYVILLNDDIKVDAHFVEELYTCIVQDGKAFSAQARMLSMQDPEVLDDAGDYYCALGWAFGRGKDGPAERYVRDGRIFAACAGAAIYRMSVFEEIGLFDERHFCYLEDIDIGYRARIFGYHNLYAARAIVYHAGSASSGSRHNAFKERLVPGNNAYLLYKNMPRAQYVLNAPLIALGRAVKRKYFYDKGLGEDYDDGLERGEYLIARAAARDYAQALEETADKASIAIEACLEEADALQQATLPLYLGGKVPFRVQNLPHYITIQGELWANCVRRLFE